MRLIFLFLTILLTASCGMKNNSPIARITAIQGQVLALESNNAARTLSDGSFLYLKDTISVGDNSSTQIEFTDGSLLHLVEKTKYRINSYHYKQSFKSDKSNSELVTGGFRLLSGAIGKTNPEQYEIKTPNATIGLRGTQLSAQLSNSVLYVSCEQGKIVIKNASGTIEIGEGLGQYAMVSMYDQRPRILIRPPLIRMPPSITPH